ncbi:Ig-like domain-containing protein [Micromonospora sp. bgisy143]|uniref:Ig-like domain-containing protein n=1 Tax=Micromonospora sp. bgisy143 TaxID=3413790 RepID=UPI003EB9C0F4
MRFLRRMVAIAASLLVLLGGLVVLPAQPALAALVRTFSPRFQESERGDVVFAGNTLVTCSTPTSQCATAQTGTTANNNDFNARYVDVDSVAATTNSSSATLTVPTGATVLWAGLWWMGSAASGDPGRPSIRLAPPGQPYTTLQGQVSTGRVATNGGVAYSAFAEVTPLVTASGSYTVGGLTTTLGANARGGWALVAAIRDPAQPLRNLAVFDGYAEISSAAADSRVTTTISGFRTPSSGTVTARIGAIASEGDAGLTGDGISFNGVALNDALNPATNFFNSSITRLGSRVTAKNPNYVNQLGFDIDYLAAPAGSIGNAQTSASVAFSTGGESYEPMALFTAIDILEPDVIATKTVGRVGGGSRVEPGDQLEYTVSVTSSGNENATTVQLTDAIPPATTYVPGSLSVNGVSRTDAAGDDQAGYVVAGNRVVANLGTGATAAAGGTLVTGAVNTVRFRARVVDSPTPGVTVANQASISYGSPTSSTIYTDLTDDPSAAGVGDPTRTDINDSPQAQAVQVGTAEDTVLTFSLRDYVVEPDGDEVTFTVTSTPPAQGTLTCTPSGACTYVPAPNVSGSVGFSYTVSDPSGRSASAAGTITVTAVNDPPVAVADRGTTAGTAPVAVNVLTNDTDVDGDPLSVVPATGGTGHGSFVCDTVRCTYTAGAGFAGEDTFEYTVRDPGDGRATGRVTVVVSPAAGSGLSISAPETAALPTVRVGTPTANGELGAVVVTDDRGAQSGSWTATVSITSFTSGRGGVVPGASVTYASGPAVQTIGTGTFLPQSGASLGAPQIAARWTGGSGPNEVTWNPSLTVALDPSLVAGTYQATIVHSVA